MDPTKPPVEVYVQRMTESGNRLSFWTTIKNAAGQEITPSVFRAYEYNGFEGLSVEEARDRALIEASEWASFFGMKATPYYENDILFQPSMTLGCYEDHEQEEMANK